MSGEAVTAASVSKLERPLPLHQRTVIKTVLCFYCSKCGREKQFSWHYAHCTEVGELVCCVSTGLKLCRRCCQPRRTGRDGGQFTGSQTVCDGCPGRPRADSREPLQVVCGNCGNTFAAKRSDSKFCSGRCRTAAHRATQSKGNQ
jgi:hypothetical protein